ncbi:uncharacterized protein [Atheta coriaria]|uniref:uncharacterized protein n=1 Tax=Dalotia coriaria TaxID=877792 RepID=UPI0031F3B1C5
MSPFIVIAAILALNGGVSTNAQKVPGIDDAMEKQICGIANQVTDVFGYGYMQPFMNDAAFNNMFTEDFKTDLTFVTSEKFYIFIKNLMYDVYRQMRANVNPQIGKQTFDQNMSEYLRSAEEHLENIIDSIENKGQPQ